MSDARPKSMLRHRGKLWVQYKGRIHHVDLQAGDRSATGSEAGAQDLLAPFSCKVVKLHVKAGDNVAAGDAVVSVEAMKMEYTYSSPKDGTIAELLVSEGEILQEGAQFVRWEESE